MLLAVPWTELSRKIAQRLGLHFPPEREQDLQRGIARAALEADMPVQDFVDRMLADQATRSELDILVSHLTVGETYFFRDPELMDALSQRILPEIIARKSDTRRLRLWSAGCCTGEEPYTLAMLLSDAIPEIERWQISILATDINPRFLHKAQAGVFGEWSFRATSESARLRYFRKLADGRYAIDERLRAMVSFAPLNLIEPVYPSVVTGTNALDLIFCRNVLMYFESAQARAVASRLTAALAEDGWLAVAACETSQSLFAELESVGFRSANAYRKTQRREVRAQTSPRMRAASVAPARPLPAAPPKPRASLPPRQAAGEQASREYVARGHSPVDLTPPLGLRAKALADQGHLDAAAALCDRWIASDALDVAAHYLKALVSMETGNLDEAETSLQRCAYLAPKEPMVTFALGNLDRLRGRHRFALNAYRYVLDQLSTRKPTDYLSYSDGLTAGQLSALANELVASEQMHERAA